MNRISCVVLLFVLGCGGVSDRASAGVGGLWKPLEGQRDRASSYNTTGANQDHIVIEAGRTHVLCDLHNTSGVIQRMWFTISSGDPTYLQKTRVTMIFDGQTTVSGVPFGMFMGTGPWCVNDLTTPVLSVMRARRSNKDQEGVGSGSFNIHWQMPFGSDAKIELHNGTERRMQLFYYLDYLKIEHKEEPLLFHADYHIQSPTHVAGREQTLDVDKNYCFLDVNDCHGRYVGTILCVESHPDRKGKWYEGDDMFVIDNEPWPPRLHGTGTEDYFGMAWGCHRRYQAFDHGVTHFEKDLTDHDRFYDGRYVLYRFHLNDPILFYEGIHASIESGTGNDCEQHYESVALWYGRRNN